MKLSITLLAITLAAASQTAFAAPSCIDAASDSDGDGWGWENNQSCTVDAVTSASSCIDTDGDGWGWNGTESCLVEADEIPAVTAACIDSDGDGYGWNGTDTCLVTPEGINPVEIFPEEPQVAVCVDTAPLNDTWGWNGSESCRLAPVLTPVDTSAIAGLYDTSDDEYTSYLNIGADGFFTLYDSFNSDGCFLFLDSKSDQEQFATQIQPIGDNLYEIYSYSFFDNILDESREFFEMLVTEDGSLSIVFIASDFDVFDDVSEPEDELLPVVTNVILEDLTFCEDDF